MKQKIIQKKDFANFVQALTSEYRVFAPVKTEGQVLFEEVTADSDVSLEYANTVNSPKAVFLPQAETLFSYSVGKKGEMKLATPEEKSRQVLLGIRPCDARSLAMLDSVFDGQKYKDNYYLDKRAATVIIGMGCIQPRSTCFCDSLGGGPFSTDGLDVLLTDIGETYLAQALTEKGDEFLSAQPALADAADESISSAQQVQQTARESMKSSVPVEGIAGKLDGLFDDPYWEDLHQKCLGCGICTYLCPTCSCFDIIDEPTESGGERIRIWDSCQFPLFTHETSGHNPRPSGKERLRQRIMHKFNYYQDNYSQTVCVGCGRCVISCPVNIDIRKVLKDISGK